MAFTVEREGQVGPAPYMRITPTASWSWNLAGRPFGHDDGEQSGPRRTVHRPQP